MSDAANKTSSIPFHNANQFPFVSELQENWEIIYSEFLSIQNDLIDYVEPHLFDQGWKVFGLWNLPHREPLVGARERCPITASLIERQVSSHGAVAFSVLDPKNHIWSHCGKSGPYLRCHLGLEIPEGNCKIRVLDQTQGWTEGKVLVFDDRLDHEAWNQTEKRRVVLLFDFIP